MFKTNDCHHVLIILFIEGNIFDWGAQAVSQILENDETFGLHDALKRIEPRPWLIDGLDDYMSRIHNV